MDGFVAIVRKQLIDCGMPPDSIHTNTKLELPGYFRPEKKWDLLVIHNSILLAAVEFKSQVGPSFGNNFNNRTEESIGSAQDVWTAYREGAFSIADRPWLGYLMLLEDCPQSTSPVDVRQPHFPVFPEFLGSSYAFRYQLLMNKLVRERLYDSGCFLMSTRDKGQKGRFTCPDSGLEYKQFFASLTGRVKSYFETQ
jgi:Restriction endonuclease XhoI